MATLSPTGLYTPGLSKSAVLRVAITLTVALLGAALLPGLASGRQNAPTTLIGTMLWQGDAVTA